MTGTAWGALPLDLSAQMRKRTAAIRLYPYLYFTAKAGDQWTTIRELHVRSGISPRTVRRAMGEIEDLDLAAVEREGIRVRITLHTGGRFGKVPLWLPRCPEVTTATLSAYAAIAYRAQGGTARTSRDEIASLSGVAPRTVTRALKSLEEAGALEYRTIYEGFEVVLYPQQRPMDGGAEGGAITVDSDDRAATRVDNTPVVQEWTPLDHQADFLCKRMAESVTAASVSGKVCKIGDDWHREARLLIQKSAVPFEEIVATLDWARNNGFWKANVKAIPKFRIQFDQLHEKMEHERGTRSNVTTGIASMVASDGIQKGSWLQELAGSDTSQIEPPGEVIDVEYTTHP